MIKTQASLQYTDKVDSIFKIGGKIYKNEGILGFYRGYSPGIVNCLHGGVQFYCYETLKNTFSTLTPALKDKNKSSKTDLKPAQTSLLAKFTSGFIFGGISKAITTVVMYPILTVRVRLQDQHRNYKNTKFGAVKAIYKEFGGLGFYRGLYLQLLLKAPLGCLIFSVYEVVYAIGESRMS